MPRAFDKLDQQENRTQWKLTAAIAAGLGVVMFALIALMSISPTASNWISDAAQAEFAGSMTPEQAPVQTAQPGRDIRTVRAY
jgi:hypothetical protein